MPPSTVKPLHIAIRSTEELWQFCDQILADPVMSAEILFGMELWRGPDGSPGQAEVIESVFAHQRTVIPAGNAVGKSQSIRVLPLLWLASHPHSYVVLTAASWEFLKRKLFPGIRCEALKQPILFPNEVLSSSFKVGDEWELVGISPTYPEPAQGWHSKGGTLWIADEASCLTPPVFEALNSLLVGPEDHGVMLGNPLRSDGPFADAIRNPKLWNVLQLSSLNSPNVRAGRTVVPGLATSEQVANFALQYGEDSVEYGIRVLGQLPDQSDMIFISRKAVLEAGKRTPIPWQEDGDLVLGIDVGWSEVGDETVFLVRGETTVHYAESFRGLSEPQLRGHAKIINGKFENRIRRIAIDATGIGSGPADTMLAEGLPVLRVVNAERANNAIKYANTRSESWGAMKDALKHLAIPREIEGVPVLDKLLQMATLEYYPTARGQIQLEPKHKYKARTSLNSPDWPDALALTYARYTGRPAFPMLSSTHLMELAPSVYPYDDGYNVHLESFAPNYDRPGQLARATWFSNSGKSATLSIHIDADGAWTVLDAYQDQAPSIAAFWRAAQFQGPRRNYAFDLASAAEYGQQQYQHHLINTIQEIDPDYAPLWIEPAKIAGMHGIELLDQLLLAALAPYKDAIYWQEHPELNPSDYHSERILAISPMEVFTALEQARLKESPVSQTDVDVAPPEGLVGDGTALVKTLRLLAVSAAAY